MFLPFLFSCFVSQLTLNHLFFLFKDLIYCVIQILVNRKETVKKLYDSLLTYFIVSNLLNNFTLVVHKILHLFLI